MDDERNGDDRLGTEKPEKVALDALGRDERLDTVDGRECEGRRAEPKASPLMSGTELLLRTESLTVG